MAYEVLTEITTSVMGSYKITCSLKTTNDNVKDSILVDGYYISLLGFVRFINMLESNLDMDTTLSIVISNNVDKLLLGITLKYIEDSFWLTISNFSDFDKELVLQLDSEKLITLDKVIPIMKMVSNVDMLNDTQTTEILKEGLLKLSELRKDGGLTGDIKDILKYD